MRTSTLLFPLLALPLFSLAACTQDVTVSPTESSFSTYDSAVHQLDYDGLDVVVLVDDSAAAASARPLFTSRVRAALARWIGERREGADHADLVHVVVRGAASGVEQRVAYLADAPANAWKTPNGELRDGDAFLNAVEAAMTSLPTSEGALRFLDAVAATQPRKPTPRTVFLVATAHDDASTKGAPEVLAALQAFERPSFSVLVDARTAEPVATEGVQLGPIAARAACGVAAREDQGWARGRAFPRLFGVADGISGRAQWADLCAVDAEAGDLLLQSSETVVDGQCLSLRPSTCTVFVAPPVSGTDALCARPELGLAPATSEARAHFLRGDHADVVATRPLCAMRALGPNDTGEGFRQVADACRPIRITDGAKPVNDSWLFLHCEATH